MSKGEWVYGSGHSRKARTRVRATLLGSRSGASPVGVMRSRGGEAGKRVWLQEAGDKTISRGWKRGEERAGIWGRRGRRRHRGCSGGQHETVRTRLYETR